MRSAIVADGIVMNVILGQIEGSVPCDEKVAIGWSWDGARFAAPLAPEPEAVDPVAALAAVHAEINAERDRRIDAGVTVSVTGYGDIPVQGREEDRINTLALKDTARDLIAAGITDPIVPFRDADNVLHLLTPA